MSTMQAPVAPSIWKLTMVPSALDPVATPVAISSIRSKLSVKRYAIAPGATSMAITRMMPTALSAPTIVRESRIKRP